MEIFKPIRIKDFEGLYAISNFGKVMSLRYGRILKEKFNATTRAHVILNYKRKVKFVYIHRLVAHEFCPSKSNRRNVVNHKDGDKRNNHARNLEWCSMESNHKHSGIHCVKKAEDHPGAKFKNEDVKAIIRQSAMGAKTSALAKKYNVRNNTIQNILRRKTYKSVPV